MSRFRLMAAAVADPRIALGMHPRSGHGFMARSTSPTVGSVYIYDTIGDGFGGITASQFAASMRDLGPVKTLSIYINSPGGDVFDGVAIYNQLKRHPAAKKIVIDGMAASIASVIAMAGDTISIANNAMMMIHDPWGFAMGNAADMRKTAVELDKVATSIVDTYAARTKGKPEALRQMMAEETWMTAEDAKRLGFADELVGENAVANVAFPLLARYKNPPKSLAELAKAPETILARMDMRIAARRART